MAKWRYLLPPKWETPGETPGEKPGEKQGVWAR